MQSFKTTLQTKTSIKKHLGTTVSQFKNLNIIFVKVESVVELFFWIALDLTDEPKKCPLSVQYYTIYCQ